MTAPPGASDAGWPSTSRTFRQTCDSNSPASPALAHPDDLVGLHEDIGVDEHRDIEAREIYINTARFRRTAYSGVVLHSSIRSARTAAARSRRLGSLAASAAPSAVGISSLVRSVQ